MPAAIRPAIAALTSLPCTATAASAVPEPATLGLSVLCGALVGLVVALARHRR
jgi:hypothetical protein